MYKFRLRPSYGSKELLMEFLLISEKNNFITTIEKALASINAKIIDSKELWMNDEILYKVNSDLGTFSVSIDTWSFVFIMSKENQVIITEIDSILNGNQDFEKEIVDYEDYK